MIPGMGRRDDESSLRGFPSDPGGRPWPSTPWTLLRGWKALAGEERRRAQDRIARLYYKPVRRFFGRVLGVRGADLSDLAQDFFVRFLELDFPGRLRHEGSFRGFLKVAARRFCASWRERHRARAGSLDGLDAPAPREEEILDEELRRDYLEAAEARVRAVLAAEGKDAYLKVLDARLRGDGDGKPPEYADIAREIGRGVFDVRNYLNRIRALFREALAALAAERSAEPDRELEELGLAAFKP
jgi:DNA-directed RNA polymerase specialized sigma24 family protein